MPDTVKIWHPITRRTKIVPRHAGIATCGNCGRSWDNTLVTGVTPAPAARCPFEGMRRITKRQRHENMLANFERFPPTYR